MSTWGSFQILVEIIITLYMDAKQILRSFFYLKQASATTFPPTCPTCAGYNNIHLTDDFIEFHHPEAVHAGKRKGAEWEEKMMLSTSLESWSQEGTKQHCKVCSGYTTVAGFPSMPFWEGKNITRVHYCMVNSVERILCKTHSYRCHGATKEVCDVHIQVGISESNGFSSHPSHLASLKAPSNHFI